MSETLVSVNTPERAVSSCEPNDVKRPTQTRFKLQPSGVGDDVSKNKSGSADAMRYRKRRKTRRGKSKRRRLKPYSRSWPDRSEQDDRETGKRANNARAKLFASGQPVAPYNTTQFLMDDHNDLQNLDVKLQAVTTNNEGSNVPVLQRPSRARDSSLSVDSGEDYFYSSPEDEGDFLTKEFSNTYEDLHAERLNSMPKPQLIQEYLQLEAKVDMLEKRLKKANAESRGNADRDKGGESTESEGNKDSDSSQKICSLKQELEKLYSENEQLRRENERLRHSLRKDQSVHSESSVDSESDSTPSCQCTDSETSCSCSNSSSASESVGCTSSEEEQAAGMKSGPSPGEAQPPPDPEQRQSPISEDQAIQDCNETAQPDRNCVENDEDML